MAAENNPSSSPAERVQPAAAGQLAVIGCSHRTAPLELRERVAFTPQQALHAADELRRSGILEEAVVLSTCNRSELYGVPSEATGGAAEVMEQFFASYHKISQAEMNGRLYRWSDSDAVRHLFRVAAGLDSMLLGEAEILGQVRTAYRRALDHGTTGPILNRVFQGALEVGKRVRAETEVGARPMSIALAGVKLAERIFGDLKGRAALILGAGAVAEQVVEHLQNRGIGELRVANRSFDRAADLAGRVGGEAIEWSAIESVLGAPDVLVASVSSAEAVLTRAMLERALAARSGKPVFVVDLGVPRNVEPAAAGLYNLYLYNVDDLGEIVEQNRRAREAEIPRAEAIIAEHVAKFEVWRSSLEATSLVDELRVHFHHDRQQLLRERLDQMPHLSREEHQRIARLTEELVERLLEGPADRLRHVRGLRRKLAGLEALRDLFGLNKEKE